MGSALNAVKVWITKTEEVCGRGDTNEDLYVVVIDRVWRPLTTCYLPSTCFQVGSLALLSGVPTLLVGCPGLWFSSSPLSSRVRSTYPFDQFYGDIKSEGNESSGREMERRKVLLA